jgi:tripartite-type tricarboxylate transporter receptor subunit TctC
MKRFTTVLLAFAAEVFTLPLWAQGFSNRPIKVIAPLPPSAATDLVVRSFGAKLSKSLAQPVGLNNRPCTNTSIGMAAGFEAEK